MPIYTLICPKCGHSEEFHLAANDVGFVSNCASCNSDITRKLNRHWAAENISAHGDTVAGCVNMANYYDDGLDAFVRGRGHRKELMKEKGLTEYVPDSITQEMTSEIRHIRKNTDFANDPTAVKAAREVGKAADKKRKQRAVRAAIDRGMAGLK